MNIEQQVAILKLQQIKLEQETTGNDARLTIMENTSDDHDKEHIAIRLRLETLELLPEKILGKGDTPEPWATLEQEEVEKSKTFQIAGAWEILDEIDKDFGIARYGDNLCTYINGKPSAHPWHLSNAPNDNAEYTRLDQEGRGIGFLMNPIEVSPLRNPDTLTKREFITPSARFIQAARRGQSLGLHAAYNIPNLTPHMVGILDVAFAHTHLGLSPYSYYHDRNDREMEQEWGKSGCGK